MSSSNQPTKRYIARMVGPFKTRRGQMFFCHNHFYMKSVNAIEKMALDFEIQKAEGIQ